MHTESGALRRLGDSDQMLADPAQDIRGYKVHGRDGKDRRTRAVSQMEEVL
ncbi:hypothetical protein [Paractinoplanes hotanensis]|uniref:Uncharacterized protein n=1 Tax=Paractinoplanes hotanensis TaxID=2906497 RepID=A0ABT0YCT7_9ACTN|nr:hypothetical protein [Actinoplanes hotanensis]MCM4083886.1 hypothetical protein [Actinoplanes hotanensis]